MTEKSTRRLITRARKALAYNLEIQMTTSARREREKESTGANEKPPDPAFELPRAGVVVLPSRAATCWFDLAIEAILAAQLSSFLPPPPSRGRLLWSGGDSAVAAWSARHGFFSRLWDLHGGDRVRRDFSEIAGCAELLLRWWGLAWLCCCVYVLFGDDGISKGSGVGL